MTSFFIRGLCGAILGALAVLPTALHAQSTDSLAAARAAYMDGNYEVAIERLRQSTATDTSARALYLLGGSHQALVQHARALEALGKAHQLDSTSVRILQAKGQLRRAIDAYKTALQVQPNRVEIYFHLATLYDDYYRDKTTAARYYHRFLTAADSLETPSRAYAPRRLEKLRPVLHF